MSEILDPRSRGAGPRGAVRAAAGAASGRLGWRASGCPARGRRPGHRALTVHTDDGKFEVVGLPGNAPQLVGAAVGTSIQTQAWLRAVHERWWTYQPALHDRVHEVIDRFLDGTLEFATDDSEPHLHMSDVELQRPAWPLPGELIVEPVPRGR